MAVEITESDIKTIVGSAAPLAREMVPTINQYAPLFKVTSLNRMACFLGQLGHESAFKYRGEVWGPTKAQRGYEGRQDLGNTHPGDGSKYRGYGGLQVTGRANVVEFYMWCINKFPGVKVPNFIDRPEFIAKAPWWVISAFWFWDTRKLNVLADKVSNDERLVAVKTSTLRPLTRRVNGGYNGLADRIAMTQRAFKVLGNKMTTSVTTLPQDGNGSPVVGTMPGVGMEPATEAPSEAEAMPAPMHAPIINAELILSVQRMLFSKGYKLVGEADGQWGRRTRNAVLAFRSDNKLPIAFDTDDNGMIDADEAIDTAFLSALMSSAPVLPAPERSSKSTKEVAAVVPEVAKAQSGKLTAIVATTGATVPGVFGAVNAIVKQFPEARSNIEPFLNSVSWEIPTWAWFFVLAAVSSFTWWLTHRAVSSGVAAYRDGERVVQPEE